MPVLNASLVSVRAIAEHDDYCDTSWIGKYTSRPSDWSIHRPSGEFYCEHVRAGLAELIPEAKQSILDRWQDEIANGATVEFCTDDDSIDNRQVVATIRYADPDVESDEDWEDIEFSPQEFFREYTYFDACAGGETVGTDEYKEHAQQDYKRMEELNSGEWSFQFLRVSATIDVDGHEMEIESPGLGGVESDCGIEYLTEIVAEQLAELRAELLKMGFTESELSELPEAKTLAEQLDS